jgi:mannosyltransferase OCH1-like enzyme
MTDLPTIFQYWDSNPPETVLPLMDTWKHADAAFQYRLFDDSGAFELMATRFDERTAAAYRSCAIPAMKADFFRYCALSAFGGIYADADTACLGGIKQLYDSCARGLLFVRHGNIANYFMIVKEPSDPLIQYALSQAILNIETRSANDVWKVTGPGIMTMLRNSKTSNSDALFKGFDIVPIQEVKKYVSFNWSLEYKKGPDHWTTAQEHRSIFKD